MKSLILTVLFVASFQTFAHAHPQVVPYRFRKIPAVASGGGGCGAGSVVMLQSTGATSATSAVVTTTNSVTAGSAIVVAVSAYNSTISDGQVTASGATFSLIASEQSTIIKTGVFIARNVSAGAMTITFNNGGGGNTIGAAEVAGLACSGGADATATAAPTATQTPDSGNMVTSGTDFVVGAFASDNSAAPAINPGATYRTAYVQVDNDVHQNLLFEYKIVGAGTYSADASITSITPNWSITASAFK